MVVANHAVEPSQPSGVRSRSMRAVALRWLVGILVAVAAVVVAWRFLAPQPVSTVTLSEREIVRTLAVVGRVRAPSQAALGAPVAGTVAEVRVREGDGVESGDTLVVLDDREPLAGVREAEAALVQTGASVQQSIEEAEREALQARRDLKRIRAVFETGGLTRQRLEQAEQRAADASSRLESLAAQGDHAGFGGEPAAVARARAAVDAARARVALTRITAPAEGVILTRTVEPGDAVSPGRALLEMAFSGPMEVVVFPGEENLGQLEVGASATVSADAFPDRVFAAIVALVAPAVDPTQGTVEVRLSVPDPPDFLRSGMTVSVNVEAGRRAAANVLPEEAVQGLGTGDAWVAVIREGRLARQPVDVGLRAGGFVEILAGLRGTEPVAVAASEAQVGDRVRVRQSGGG